MTGITAIGIALAIFLGGCRSVGEVPPKETIILAEEQSVSSCSFLSDVHGTSSFYGIFVNPALKAARKNAIERANSLGATHIVFTNIHLGYGSTGISAKAYKC